MEPFLAGPYYAYHILATFQQRIKLPHIIENALDHYNRLNLTGKQLTPSVLDALLDVICHGHLHNIYISPFYPASNNLAERQFVNQWGQVCYTHGCGALIFNYDRSSAFLNRLDQYTLNRPVHLKSTDAPLAHEPVIFETNHEMANAVRSMILTGSLDDSHKPLPLPSDACRGVDPTLLFWIENELGFIPESPNDLNKLSCLSVPHYIPRYPVFPDWLAPDPGNWSLLGDLPNLEALFMPEVHLEDWSFLSRCSQLKRVSLTHTNLSCPTILEHMTQVTYLNLPAMEFEDFSFLERLSAVEILDLSWTNFRDCTILTRMPNLKRILLPAERQLLHLDLLDPLPMQVKTDTRKVRGKDVDAFELILPRPTEPLDLTPPYKVLHIIADDDTCEGLKITEKYVKSLMHSIRNGDIEVVYASLQPWGEDEFLEIDIADSWATLNFSDSDLDYGYCIYNPDHAGDQEDAPPEVGGQSPVPKQHAIQNLSLAADCLGYFIKTGSIYPGAYWAKYYR